MSSNNEFEEKIEVNSFALSTEDDMTLGPIINTGHNHFASVHNLIGDLPEFMRSNLSIFNLGLDKSCM